MIVDKLVDYGKPNSFGNKLRKKRSFRLREIVEKISEEHGQCRILDLGGTYLYWNIFPSNWFEKNNISVTLLNIDSTHLPPEANERFQSVVGNACALRQYEENEFDLVHSNSVIEHVGSWSEMSAMASESMRVGKAYYHQTPYFWFPIEPHFIFPLLHWLPLSIRAKIAQRVALGNWPRAVSFDEAMRAQTSAVLLDYSMMKALFQDATIEFERFLLLPKSMAAYHSISICNGSLSGHTAS